MICAVAGYDDPSRCNPLAITQDPPRLNPRYRKLTIWAGHHPDLPDPGDDPGSDPEEDPEGDITVAATTFQLDEVDGILDDRNAAICRVSKRAFDYPTLKQIINDRTCEKLRPADSGLMTSLGAHLLHEMFHWRYLVRNQLNKINYDNFINHVEQDLDLNEIDIYHTSDYGKHRSNLMQVILYWLPYPELPN